MLVTRFSPFPKMFSTLSKTEIIILTTFKLSSATVFDSVDSKIVSLGKELSLLLFNNFNENFKPTEPGRCHALPIFYFDKTKYYFDKTNYDFVKTNCYFDITKYYFVKTNCYFDKTKYYFDKTNYDFVKTNCYFDKTKYYFVKTNCYFDKTKYYCVKTNCYFEQNEIRFR